jgi:hypothetical protein
VLTVPRSIATLLRKRILLPSAQRDARQSAEFRPGLPRHVTVD